MILLVFIFRWTKVYLKFYFFAFIDGPFDKYRVEQKTAGHALIINQVEFYVYDEKEMVSGYFVI